MNDAVGNRTNDGRFTYTYSDRGRLSHIGGTTNLDFLYNGLGQRVVKVSAATSYYVYDEAGHTIGTYGGPSDMETVYLDEMPVAVLGSGTAYYALTDHLNAPLVLARGDGTIAWDWRGHDPFGIGEPVQTAVAGVTGFSHLGLPGPVSSMPTSVSIAFDHRFPGQVADQETGLYYNYYRDYDPQTGRYIESDPVGLNGGTNTYAYASGNPLSYVDLFGLTRAQVDCMLGKARGNNPDLKVPDTVDISSNFEGMDSAVTNPATMNVTLSNFYNGDLDRDGMYSLYKTLVHESIHRTKGRMDTIRRPFNHPDIYAEAAKRAKDFFKKDESNACTCAK